MDQITLKARAKVNLLLDVRGVRSDGYHELCSVMQTLELHDTLTLRETDAGTVELTCNAPGVPADTRNLAYRAARYMLDTYGIKRGVSLELRKEIPAAAGLGGGSADCAAALKGVNTLFSLGLSLEKLMDVGRMFGADVPFCLFEGTALAEGIGEKLRRLPAHPDVWVLLAKPLTEISTRDVFARYDACEAGPPGDFARMERALQNGDVRRIADCFGNMLRTVTSVLCPEVDGLVGCMKKYGALNAQMTGSGPAVFGYFEAEAIAQGCIGRIKREFPAGVTLLTRVYNPGA